MNQRPRDPNTNQFVKDGNKTPGQETPQEADPGQESSELEEPTPEPGW